jgi:HD-GYP domain-containing protein (c-di-GMP phosphodiesterase class II)
MQYHNLVNMFVLLKEIKKKSGTQFDPKVVDAFRNPATSPNG